MNRAWRSRIRAGWVRSWPKAASRARPFASPLLAVLALSALTALSACLDLADGGSSEQQNTVVAGMVRDEEGLPVVGARIRIRGSDYARDTAQADKPDEVRQDALTDSRGWFRARAKGSGGFVLEVSDPDDRGTTASFRTEPRGGSLDLDTLIVLPRALVTGRLLSGGSRFVQVLGLERVARADAQGFFRFAGLPPGSFRFRVLGSGSADTAAFPVEVPPLRREFDLGRIGSQGVCRDTACEYRLLESIYGEGFSPSDSAGTVELDEGGSVTGVTTPARSTGREVWWPLLGRLPGLQGLTYRGDSIAHFPEIIGRLDSLTYLDLSGVRLDSLPRAVAALPALKELDLDGNRLRTLPDFPGAFASLVDLRARSNRFEVFPSVLLPLRAMQVLHLDNNLIRSVPPEILGPEGWTAIREFRISENRICNPSQGLLEWLAAKDSLSGIDNQRCGPEP